MTQRSLSRNERPYPYPPQRSLQVGVTTPPQRLLQVEEIEETSPPQRSLQVEETCSPQRLLQVEPSTMVSTRWAWV